MSDRSIRLFLDPALAAGTTRALSGAQAHYLGRVMRCRTGDRIRLFDGVSGEWWARLEVGRRAVTATVETAARPQASEPGPVLAMAPIRRARLEWALEKGTELGMAAFQPVATERSGDERLNPERLHAITVEAAEQCERLTVPEVRPLVPLAAWLGTRSAEVPLYVAMERSDVPELASALARHGPGDLLVGPEGGFAAAERALLAGARTGVPIGLGPRILRAETAAVAGLALLALAGRGE
jgi:16S rRNA (uracil1498-N3)-methyltransferase